jgi:hypothetical protein
LLHLWAGDHFRGVISERESTHSSSVQNEGSFNNWSHMHTQLFFLGKRWGYYVFWKKKKKDAHLLTFFPTSKAIYA